MHICAGFNVFCVQLKAILEGQTCVCVQMHLNYSLVLIFLYLRALELNTSKKINLTWIWTDRPTAVIML